MKNKFHLRITLVCMLFYAVLSIAGGYVIYFSYLNAIKEHLSYLSQRIHDDIRYVNGVWDLYYYDADPQLPASEPIYIFTTEGYVIDRWKPINGLLNSSDLRYLLSFTTPETVSVNGHEWRMYSRHLESKGGTIGVITTSFYNPQDDEISDIDDKLQKDAELILSQMSIEGNHIDTSRVDIRQSDYNTGVRIVDKFNNLLLKSNNSNSIDRTPGYIDRSYIADELQREGFRQVSDANSKEPFLILSTPYQADSVPVGVIIVAGSLKNMYTQLTNYVLTQAGILLVATFITWFLINRYVIEPKQILHIRSLHFDREESVLHINNDNIDIPTETHQYYLLDTLIFEPERQWEAEDLLKRFHENESDAKPRQVYDAMLLLNRRVEAALGTKLVVLKDKVYSFNPEILPYITS